MARRIPLLCLALLAASVPASALAQEDETVDEVSETAKSFVISFLHEGGKPNWLDYDFRRGVPLFVARINGTDVCALVDTASDRTIVDVGLASSLGLKVLESSQVAWSNSGKISVKMVADVSVEIPGQIAFRSDLMGIDMPDYDCPIGGRLSFVLGKEVLQSLAFAFDPKKQKMIFVRSGSITPRKDEYLALNWRGGIINTTINTMPANLKVDTGSSTLLLMGAKGFEKYFPNEELVPLGSSTDASGLVDNDYGVKAATVSVGDLSMTRAAKRVASKRGPHDGNLGFVFFIWTQAIFDAGQDVIFVRKPNIPND